MTELMVTPNASSFDCPSLQEKFSAANLDLSSYTGVPQGWRGSCNLNNGLFPRLRRTQRQKFRQPENYQLSKVVSGHV